LDPLQLRAAVALITVHLLTLLILSPFSWGGGIFVIMKILFFGNCCESLECEENISKLKNVNSSKLQTPHVTQRYFCFQILQTIPARLLHAALMKPIEEQGGAA
jgi:hypothetical protein